LIENIMSYPMTPNGLSSCSTLRHCHNVGKSSMSSSLANPNWIPILNHENPMHPHKIPGYIYPGVFLLKPATSYIKLITPVSQKTSSRVDWRY
jgi:hypothetical protein